MSHALKLVGSDQGPFIPVSVFFTCNGVKWNGVVVASPTALYILKTAQEKAADSGGLMGSVIAEAATKNSDGIRTCRAHELPDPVNQQLDPKKKNVLKDVIIIPRETVDYAQSTSWWPKMRINVGNDVFTFSTHLFSFRSLVRKMGDSGWVFNQPLTPRFKPIHDTRTADEKANPPVDKSKQIATYIAIGFCAVLILIAIIAALSTLF